MARLKQIIFTLFFAIGILPTIANAACLAVTDDAQITLSEAEIQSLSQISFGREQVFEALYNTSEFETGGCWATPVGNFDAQTLSVGVLQWNYGQNSLQDLMIAYRASFATPELFNQEIATIMPNYGAVAFAEDCLVIPFTISCKEKLLAAHGADGKLNPTIKSEYEALFNSTPMRQVQTSKFIEFLGGLKPKLNLLFGENPTQLQTKWGIDIAIQQGFVRYNDAQGVSQPAFLNPADAAAIRALYVPLDREMKTKRMLSAIRWYSGLCGGIYQGVTTEICNYNIKSWCAVVVRGVTDEQFDLFELTYVRSRIAQGQSGRWQANAFSRRAKIVLNTGRVGTNALPLPRGVRKTRRCNSMLI
ncbi:MAG: hypothetical protein FD163_680 [Hyphomonadaceae bacterium]|nr:MAG: hypothetical protein FD163_680 [Hyphomonadaceae bacterium]